MSTAAAKEAYKSFNEELAGVAGELQGVSAGHSTGGAGNVSIEGFVCAHGFDGQTLRIYVLCPDESVFDKQPIVEAAPAEGGQWKSTKDGKVWKQAELVNLCVSELFNASGLPRMKKTPVQLVHDQAMEVLAYAMSRGQIIDVPVTNDLMDYMVQNGYVRNRDGEFVVTDAGKRELSKNVVIPGVPMVDVRP